MNSPIHREWPSAAAIERHSQRVDRAEVLFYAAGLIALAFIVGVIVGVNLIHFGGASLSP